MQDVSLRRSNEARTADMRRRLLDAARRLFVANGYAATSTPEIVAAAGVTRGALYHHFADKAAIFRAVLENEAAEVEAAIEASDGQGMDALEALLMGASSYLTAMAVPGRTRLLLVDGPAVLGRTLMREIETRHGDATLEAGLVAAMSAGLLPSLPIRSLNALMSAMFERAALEMAEGDNAEDYISVSRAIIHGLSNLIKNQTTAS